MTSGPIPLTAQMTATAVVAAARVYGDDPAKALGPGSARMNRRCLSPAVAALIVHTGQKAKTVCALLEMNDSSFYSARSQAFPPFAQAQAAAAEALLALGPAYTPPPPAEPTGKPRKERQPKPGPLTVGLPGQSDVRPAGNSALRAATAQLHQLPTPAPIRQARAIRSSGAYSRATTIRLKPITPRVLRYCERFLRADWDIEEVAELFDISPDALAIQSRVFSIRGRVA